MSLQKTKKILRRELRAKRGKQRRAVIVGGLLLVFLSAGGAYLLWNKHRPAALLQQGIRLEQQKKLQKALYNYNQLFEIYSQSPEAAEALYRSGRIQQHDLADHQRALFYYLRLEKDYPQSSYVAQAQQQAASLTKNRLEDCGQAIPIFQRLQEQSDHDADRYLYEIADCYVRQDNWSQAAIEFEMLLASYPESKLRATVSYRLADAWLLNGQREKARTGFASVVKEYPESPQAQEAGFRLAEMLEEDNRLRDALKAFSELTRYPQQDLLKKKIKFLKERLARKLGESR